MIAPYRVKAYFLRHLYEISATFDRKADIIFWPTIDLLIFGFLSLYIQELDVRANFAGAIVGALILWTLIFNIQRDISISLLEDAWSWNLFNLFSTPLRASEALIGSFALSFLKAVLTIVFVISLAWGLFSFNILSIGPIIAFYILNVFIFGWAFGCLTSALIFRFGAKVQILAWSLIAVLYPISGVFYPLSTLPDFLATMARALPVSYIFEGLRSIIISGQMPSFQNMALAFVLNLGYLAFGIYLFMKGFKHAKDRGWFIHPT